MSGQHPAEYTIPEIVPRLGALINKAQQIRNGLPVPMEVGDARHVCLSGFQTSITPLMLSCGAIEFANQGASGIDLARLCGVKATNKQLLDWFDTWAKVVLLVLIHFRIEGLFLNIMLALEPGYKERRFSRIASDLFDRLTLRDKDEVMKTLRALSILRNSLHNNSINQNEDFDEVIGGERFVFKRGRHTEATILDHIHLIDMALDIIKEVSLSPVVLKLPVPIPDQFHVEMGL